MAVLVFFSASAGAGIVATHLCIIAASRFRLLFAIPLSTILVIAAPYAFPILTNDQAVVDIGTPYLQIRLAGMIAVGQRVELQFQAYPHQFFGTRSAVVTAISTIVLPPDQVDTDLPLKGPVFVVRARLGHARIQAGSRSWPLPPGTSFQADLVRARWPLYRWLLRSVSGDPVRS